LTKSLLILFFPASFLIISSSSEVKPLYPKRISIIFLPWVLILLKIKYFF